MSYIAVSGGIFVDMTIHDFDMARYLVGSRGGGVRQGGGADRSGDRCGGRRRHGGRGADARQRGDHDDRQQSAGRVRLRPAGRGARIGGPGHVGEPPEGQRAGLLATGSTGANLQDFFLDSYRESFVEEWLAFIDYVAGGGPSPVPGADGRAPVVIGLAAWESVQGDRSPSPRVDAPRPAGRHKGGICGVYRRSRRLSSAE